MTLPSTNGTASGTVIRTTTQESLQSTQEERHGCTWYSSCKDPAIRDAFSNDGFVCLSGVLLCRSNSDQLLRSTSYIHEWHTFAESHFQHTFEALYTNGHTPFPQHCQLDNADGGSVHPQYALQAGVKHGFREIVMRSPGRYELSLLHTSTLGSSSYAAPPPPPPPPPPLEPLLHVLEPLLPSILGESSSSWQDVQICHVSILMSTPGATDQAWHSDGGHVDLSQHLPCHCANLFIPLMDVVSTALGPTELRPGTHYHTRDLARCMLLAKARKTLRAPVLPLLQRGDVLVFDYRILHRGRANESLTVGRPMLVLTIAKSWFRDISNFPSVSLYCNITKQQQQRATTL